MTFEAGMVLPSDADRATLIGRTETVRGPCVCWGHDNHLFDVTAAWPTVGQFLRDPARSKSLIDAPKCVIGRLEEIVPNSEAVVRDPSKPALLAPIDLQAVKVCGVTFVTSMVERVVEEMAKGDPANAGQARVALDAEIGKDLRGIEPRSQEAARVKAVLEGRGLWSRYFEVGLGPDVETFTHLWPVRYGFVKGTSALQPYAPSKHVQTSGHKAFQTGRTTPTGRSTHGR